MQFSSSEWLGLGRGWASIAHWRKEASKGSLTESNFSPGWDCLPECSVWRYPKSEQNLIRNFFPIPNFSDTESYTFFSIPNFFATESESETYLKNGKVSKPRSFKTETSPKIPKIWKKPNPKFFPLPIFFNTESKTIQNIESFETEMSHLV